MTSSFAIARIGGVEIRIHWSWIVILALVTVSLGGEVLPQQNRSLAPAGLWLIASGTSLLALVSVMLHELAHVAIARRNGIDGRTVTIQLLGGTYTLESRPVTPGQQLRVASAGPAVSVLLAIAFAALGLAIYDAGWGGILSMAAFILADWNLFVAIVNLLPGYPLDGASIIRSIIWRFSKREDTATALTGRIGRGVGYGLIALAFVVFVFVDALLAVFVAFAGWLLAAGGSAVERREFLRNLVAGLRVRDAMDDDLARVPPQLTLDTFASDYLSDTGSAVVVERPDEALGIVGSGQARRSRRKWSELHAADVMTPLAQLPAVLPDADLWPVLEQLERSGLDAVVVRPGGTDALSFLTRRSAARAIHQRAQERVQSAIVLGQVTPRAAGRGWRRFQASGPLDRPGPFQSPKPEQPSETKEPEQSDDDGSPRGGPEDRPGGTGADEPRA